MVKNPPANAGDTGSMLGPGSSSWKGNGNSLQYSSLENPMDRGVWWATSPWGHKELDMTECVHTHTHTHIHIHNHQHIDPRPIGTRR